MRLAFSIHNTINDTEIDLKLLFKAYKITIVNKIYA